MSKLLALRTKLAKSLNSVCREVWADHGLKVTAPTLKRWEDGGRITLEAARVLADYYGVKVEDVA